MDQINIKEIEVLVFKTNIQEHQVLKVQAILSKILDDVRISFDFEDCDNILRIETRLIINKEVERVLIESGYYCKELE